MQLFLELLILLLVTQVFSEGAERFKQPAAIGELTAGIMVVAVFWCLEPNHRL